VGALHVTEAIAVDNDLVHAFAVLIPQLSRSSPPGRPELEEMVRSPATMVLVARLAVDGETVGDIVGSLTLVLFRIPTGRRAIIEDVVVDEAARGRGVGEALTLAALDRAQAAGVGTVDLTSRPSRESANRLYQRLGFELRETNVYRYSFAEPASARLSAPWTPGRG
jgi:ribosomal protein S18 acetylase RimI-like enzyme